LSGFDGVHEVYRAITPGERMVLGDIALPTQSTAANPSSGADTKFRGA